MVIKLTGLPTLIICNIIGKMDSLSFRDASLSSRYISHFTQKNKNYIRIFLKGYQLQLFEQWPPADDNLVICIQFCMYQNTYHSRPEELLKTRPELDSFTFERIAISHPSGCEILNELRNGNVFGHTVAIRDMNIANQAIATLRPSILQIECADDTPSDVFDTRLLKTLTGISMRHYHENQIDICLEEIVPFVRDVYLTLATPLIRLEIIVNHIKKNVKNMENGHMPFHKQFTLNVDVPPSNKLIHLVSTFRDIPHTLWKRFGFSRHDSIYNYVFLFIRAPEGSTLCVYMEEECVECVAKSFTVSYKLISSTEQFLEFFESSLKTESKDAMKELSGGRQRMRQFNQLKRNFFASE